MAAKSRTHETYETLKAGLLDGRYHPGLRLKIDVLCKDLGVSPGAVREALSRLTSEGLVMSVPQRGFIVSPVSRAELIDLTAVRIDIERRCLQDSVAHGDLAWEGHIKSIWHQLKNTSVSSGPDDMHPSDDWSRLHSEFHEALTAACQSPWWLRLRQIVFYQAERYRRLILPYVVFSRDADQEHEDIVDAVLARDAERAGVLIEKHLNTTLQSLLQADPPFFGEFDPEAESADTLVLRPSTSA